VASRAPLTVPATSLSAAPVLPTPKVPDVVAETQPAQPAVRSAPSESRSSFPERPAQPMPSASRNIAVEAPVAAAPLSTAGRALPEEQSAIQSIASPPDMASDSLHADVPTSTSLTQSRLPLATSTPSSSAPSSPLTASSVRSLAGSVLSVLSSSSPPTSTRVLLSAPAQPAPRESPATVSPIRVEVLSPVESGTPNAPIASAVSAVPRPEQTLQSPEPLREPVALLSPSRAAAQAAADAEAEARALRARLEQAQLDRKRRERERLERERQVAAEQAAMLRELEELAALERQSQTKASIDNRITTPDPAPAQPTAPKPVQTEPEIDPVLQEYMSRVLQQRAQSQTASKQEAPASVGVGASASRRFRPDEDSGGGAANAPSKTVGSGRTRSQRLSVSPSSSSSSSASVQFSSPVKPRKTAVVSGPGSSPVGRCALNLSVSLCVFLCGTLFASVSQLRTCSCMHARVVQLVSAERSRPVSHRDGGLVGSETIYTGDHEWDRASPRRILNHAGRFFAADVTLIFLGADAGNSSAAERCRTLPALDDAAAPLLTPPPLDCECFLAVDGDAILGVVGCTAAAGLASSAARRARASLMSWCLLASARTPLDSSRHVWMSPAAACVDTSAADATCSDAMVIMVDEDDADADKVGAVVDDDDDADDDDDGGGGGLAAAMLMGESIGGQPTRQ
jgi:hypothetical protein